MIIGVLHVLAVSAVHSLSHLWHVHAGMANFRQGRSLPPAGSLRVSLSSRSGIQAAQGARTFRQTLKIKNGALSKTRTGEMKSFVPRGSANEVPLFVTNAARTPSASAEGGVGNTWVAGLCLLQNSAPKP